MSAPNGKGHVLAANVEAFIVGTNDVSRLYAGDVLVWDAAGVLAMVGFFSPDEADV